MDPYTVSEREEMSFWDKFWAEYATYPPGTRFRHKDGGTIVKLANSRTHSVDETYVLNLGTGEIEQASDHFVYPSGFRDWDIRNSADRPYNR